MVKDETRDFVGQNMSRGKSSYKDPEHTYIHKTSFVINISV